MDVDPVAKGRARHGRGKTWTPEKTRKAEEHIAWLGRLAMGAMLPYRMALRVEARFVMPMPKSWHKKEKLLIDGRPHSHRPDTDNLVKLLGDAWNNIVWADDSQISEWRVRKQWAHHGEITVAVYRAE